MRSLVVYDSVYGNTEMIAKVISRVLATDAKLVKDIEPHDLEGLGLIIVGSPTHGGRPTPALESFFKRLPQNSLKNVSVAAFDTRFSADTHGLFLHGVMKILGFAAPRIQTLLLSKGAVIVAKPAGFIVEDKEGGLVSGELNRAKEWAQTLKQC